VIYYAPRKTSGCTCDQRPALAAGIYRPLADAGIATVNFAVDTIKAKAGLPKAFEHVRANFEPPRAAAIPLRLYRVFSTPTSAARI